MCAAALPVVMVIPETQGRGRHHSSSVRMKLSYLCVCIYSLLFRGSSSGSAIFYMGRLGRCSTAIPSYDCEGSMLPSFWWSPGTIFLHFWQVFG